LTRTAAFISVLMLLGRDDVILPLSRGKFVVKDASFANRNNNLGEDEGTI
jgi:hypothetical protein